MSTKETPFRWEVVQSIREEKCVEKLDTATIKKGLAEAVNEYYPSKLHMPEPTAAAPVVMPSTMPYVEYAKAIEKAESAFALSKGVLHDMKDYVAVIDTQNKEPTRDASKFQNKEPGKHPTEEEIMKVYKNIVTTPLHVSTFPSWNKKPTKTRDELHQQIIELLHTSTDLLMTETEHNYCKLMRERVEYLWMDYNNAAKSTKPYGAEMLPSGPYNKYAYASGHAAGKPTSWEVVMPGSIEYNPKVVAVDEASGVIDYDTAVKMPIEIDA